MINVLQSFRTRPCLTLTCQEAKYYQTRPPPRVQRRWQTACVLSFTHISNKLIITRHSLRDIFLENTALWEITARRLRQMSWPIDLTFGLILRQRYFCQKLTGGALWFQLKRNSVNNIHNANDPVGLVSDTGQPMHYTRWQDIIYQQPQTNVMWDLLIKMPLYRTVRRWNRVPSVQQAPGNQNPSSCSCCFADSRQKVVETMLSGVNSVNVCKLVIHLNFLLPFDGPT